MTKEEIPTKKNPHRNRKSPNNPKFNPNLPISRANPIIDIDKAVELRLKGLSYADIARYFNVAIPSVLERINGYVADNIDTEMFKKHRPELLAGKQAEILKSLTSDELNKASPYQKVGMMTYLHGMERLERDKSTANIAYADLSNEMNELDAELARLEAELGREREKE